MDKKILIRGVEFKYNSKDQYEKDGHVFCINCDTQMDGRILNILGKDVVVRNKCRCEIEKEKQYFDKDKENRISILKSNCFDGIENLKKYRFDFNRSTNSKEEILGINYVNKFNEMIKENIGLLLYGNVGSGKTYLASCIANGIIEKYLYEVNFRSIPQIVNDMEKRGFDIDKNYYINKLCSVKLLILDDFGIERKTEYITEKLYEIINMRYIKKLPTIISTNLSLKEIQNETESISLKRIYSRILEMCIPIKIVAEDRRIIESKCKIEKAKKYLIDN